MKLKKLLLNVVITGFVAVECISNISELGISAAIVPCLISLGKGIVVLAINHFIMNKTDGLADSHESRDISAKERNNELIKTIQNKSNPLLSFILGKKQKNDEIQEALNLSEHYSFSDKLIIFSKKKSRKVTAIDLLVKDQSKQALAYIREKIYRPYVKTLSEGLPQNFTADLIHIIGEYDIFAKLATESPSLKWSYETFLSEVPKLDLGSNEQATKESKLDPVDHKLDMTEIDDREIDLQTPIPEPGFAVHDTMPHQVPKTRKRKARHKQKAAS